MKNLVIAILVGFILIPAVSWYKFGFDWGISAWFGIIGVLGLVVVIVTKAQGKKLW